MIAVVNPSVDCVGWDVYLSLTVIFLLSRLCS